MGFILARAPCMSPTFSDKKDGMLLPKYIFVFVVIASIASFYRKAGVSWACSASIYFMMP